MASKRRIKIKRAVDHIFRDEALRDKFSELVREGIMHKYDWEKSR